MSLAFCLLSDSLIRYRRMRDGHEIKASLPALLAALAADEVRDYPALRPHQRHPWHAFLVQLAAMALHRAGHTEPFNEAVEWDVALRALTPDDPEAAAWHLVAPADRPALLQAPVPGGDISGWKSRSWAADELDMLVTSKNHDLKTARALRAEPEDWLFALLSLQTQEGFLGAGNYGISRMNGGFASRPGIGVEGSGGAGSRWQADVAALLNRRAAIVEHHGFQPSGGLALVWLAPWDGAASLAFSALDPFYIEICRRLRLTRVGDAIVAVGTGSSAARIECKSLQGLTGDAWTPIDIAAGKALTITDKGFPYELVVDLMYGSAYAPPLAQDWARAQGGERLQWVARGVTRGKGKTQGYHERHVPISPKMRGLLAQQKPVLAKIAGERIKTIAEVRKLLWLALCQLFGNGAATKEASPGNKNKANDFARPFEQAEDTRFFDDLNDEIEAEDASAARLRWLLGLVDRADAVLQRAFDAGPRNGIQRYRARSAALTRFHGALRGPKSPLPDLAQHYRQQLAGREEPENELA